ncbi:MAG: lipase family protein [Verrucomicrobiota bacterium]
MLKKKRTLLAAAVALILPVVALGTLAFSATRTVPMNLPASLTGNQRGEIVSVERVGKYPAFAVRLLVGIAGRKIESLKELPAATSGATLFRLSYVTENHDGSPVVASGLVAIPKEQKMNEAVVYFHGTSARRQNSPSFPGSKLSRLLTAAVTGTGNLLIAPDYIGLGGSEVRHPYLHSDSAVACTIDLLSATRTFLRHLNVKWPPSLFLLGFSQGGHSTLAVQRALEQMNDPKLQVAGAAAIAGPTQLRKISFPQTLTGTSKSHAFYLAYITSAYANVYQQPLNSILKDDYATSFQTIFDGHHPMDTIREALPEDPTEMFREDFLDTYHNGHSNWFLNALSENSVADWIPQAPLRLFYGNLDQDVLPLEATSVATAMKDKGAPVEAVSLGELDHGKAMIHGIATALKWLRGLSPGNEMSNACFLFTNAPQMLAMSAQQASNSYDPSVAATAPDSRTRSSVSLSSRTRSLSSP